MYTKYTLQDWLKIPEGNRVNFAKIIIDDYKSSLFFTECLRNKRYFAGDNPTLDEKYLLEITTRESIDENGHRIKRAERRKIEGNRVSSNYVFRFITQENQFLLGNGLVTDDKIKEKLGVGFDKVLEQIGEKALLFGMSYGYWNLDHLESIPAAKDNLSGAVALLDETTSNMGVFLQFWQLSDKRPMYMRIFENDGISVYSSDDKGNISIVSPKRAYAITSITDGIGSRIIGAENYAQLPVFILGANDEMTSEFRPSIKSKVDCYDRILSDFGDNLDRANDVYWALNNFGGDTNDALNVIKQIRELKIAMGISDGNMSSTIEPKTIEVPYQARQTALSVLNTELYADAMALDMDALTGGSLTNVAIMAAMTNLNLKCDRYEWQVFQFIQSILKMLGIETEDINFTRSNIVNKSEQVQDIYMMRSDISRRKALELNPYINPDEIDEIIEDTEAETVSGKPSIEELQKEIDEENAGQEPDVNE